MLNYTQSVFFILYGIVCYVGAIIIYIKLVSRALNGEFTIFEITCLRCNKRFKSRINYLVDLRFFIHRIFCRARAGGS